MFITDQALLTFAYILIIAIICVLLFLLITSIIKHRKLLKKAKPDIKAASAESLEYYSNHCIDCGKEINPAETIFVGEFDAYMCDDCVHKIMTMLDPDPESEIIQNEIRDRTHVLFPEQLPWYRIHIQSDDASLEYAYRKEDQLIQAMDDLHAMKFASDFLIYQNVISVTVFATRLTQPGEDGETVERQIYHEKGKANR